MRSRTTEAAVLTALAVALGMLLSAIPNLEAVSAVSFFSGFLLGWRGGGLVGGISMMILSLMNPLGPAPPPVLMAQIAGMASVGACGHLWRKLAVRYGKPGLLAIALGCVLTLLYDLVTNYGVAVSIGRWQDPLPVIISGAPLSVLHIASNGMIFGGTGTLMMRKHARKET
jgi:uncharacterized membrane protein